MAGLGRLEYRGYDSAGVALVGADGLDVVRSVGRMCALEAQLHGADDARLGIGHTRWATHGSVEQRNAHPHLDCGARVAVVHNGIIENAEELRAELVAQGHDFRSEVDSEVVGHLVEDALAREVPPLHALRSAVARLHGSWALLAVVSGHDGLLAACHRSPLVFGVGEEGQYLASDVTALLDRVERIQVLQDGDLLEVGETVTWLRVDGTARVPPQPVPCEWRSAETSLGHFEDFMDKEIAEQADVVRGLVTTSVDGILSGDLWRELALPDFGAVRLLGCGTSHNAAQVLARALRDLAGIPTTTEVASEARTDRCQPGVLTVALSQSGETADVLTAVRDLDGPLLALTNVGHSTLARRADAVALLRAGPEVGVAATKTFTAQVVLGLALTLSLIQARTGRLDPGLVDSFCRLPDSLEESALIAGPVADMLAGDLTGAGGFVFIARGAACPYAAEGALKLKEITYRYAEALPAGELKHGPIALVEEGTPVVVVGGCEVARLRSNVAEVRARGARVISVGSSDCTFPVLADGPVPPWGPLEAVLPLQHLARSLAVRLGRDVDKPRNLAKSVTVD